MIQLVTTRQNKWLDYTKTNTLELVRKHHFPLYLLIDINRTKIEVKMEWNKHGKQNEGKLKKINERKRLKTFTLFSYIFMDLGIYCK